MDINLKDKILDTALNLLNNKGYAHVTMRDISNALDISPGNLTYYFKKKKDLMIALSVRQYEEYKNLDLPTDITIEAFNRRLIKLQAFREKYYFYFASFSELPKLSPEMAKTQIRVVNEFYNTYNNIFINFISQGIMKEEAYTGQYEDLSISLLALNMYGTQQLKLLKEFLPNQKNILSVLWGLILPNLTAKGIAEYNKISL